MPRDALKVNVTNNTKIRPFLKWPGGKFRLVELIQKNLPPGKKLIEPFAGGAAVFLNTDYPKYLLNDINPDLILLYQTLVDEKQEFIDYCRDYFLPKYNRPRQYYALRKRFNHQAEGIERAALFLYLNRHGYNGLIRYNASRREFNVPFGDYKRPYFPDHEMDLFVKRARGVQFSCTDFRTVLKNSRKGHVVYCDPPYVPLSMSANFTHYQPNGFSIEDQYELAHLAYKLSQRGIPVLLSNHATQLTREVYKAAKIVEFPVRRTISCKGQKRKLALELLALFNCPEEA